MGEYLSPGVYTEDLSSNSVIIEGGHTPFSDINDAAELLILNQRFPYTRWLLFSGDLSADS